MTRTLAALQAACRAARARAREASRRADRLERLLTIATVHNAWRATLPVITDVTALDAATLDLISESSPRS